MIEIVVQLEARRGSEGALVRFDPAKEKLQRPRQARLLSVERISSLAFWLLVVIPTACAVLYYGFLATPRYESEAKFVVRSSTSSRSSGLDALFRTIGISRTVDDTNLVVDYILSRDALTALEEKLPLRKIFGDPKADALARFPRPFLGQSFERLYDYYLDRVSAVPDSETGIVTLTVVTFRPEDSKAIAAALLQLAEKMVNDMNVRAQDDFIRVSESEVTRAENWLIEAERNLTQFRDAGQLVDPSQDSAATLKLITDLTAELAQTQAALDERRKSTPQSPLIATLQARVAALTAQIAIARAQLAGTKDALATKLSNYESLTLTRELAEKALGSAMVSLEAARQEARRQQIYVEEVTVPNLPDRSTEPRRLRMIATFFVTGFMGFAVVWILSVGVKEHAQ
ncbi:capsule biosynthesis protein [Segnochrobactrum spirostomi]|uniref:capsule biosynthesis protein n=1 Tax=Segnochrobactrum spirostomi TaxID=2608987 RepID=UPI001AD80361|nr:capsule biosynthesis protein [Segnochrobactrum spirostomi]